jgi:plastocyanin
MRILLGLGLLALLGLSAPGAPLPAPQTWHIEISGHAFHPNLLTLGVGDTVIWTNEDAVPHSVLPQLFTETWNSDDLQLGQSYDHTFDAPDVIPYFCGVHPGMKGNLVVAVATPA